MKKLMLHGALALWLGYVCAPTCAAQVSLAGDWAGGLDSGKQWLGIAVRFRGDGAAGGAIDLPQYNLTNQPLSQISVEGNHVRFEWPRGEMGTAVFEGEFTEGGLVGNYRRGDIRSTFYLVREPKIAPRTYDQYFGNYRLSPGRFLTVGVIGDDAPRLSYLDTGTRRTGYLFPLSETEFFAGPTYEIPLPIDFKIAFVKNARGEVVGLRWSRKGAPAVSAPKSRHRREEIKFRSGDAELTASLITPGTNAPHPAIILVSPGYTFSLRHGDTPASFLREGLAVLTLTSKTLGGKSTDYRRASFEERARDALAGLSALKARQDIDAKRIGLFGASLSSWVAPIAATLSPDVAFMILQVPPALPVAENIVHEIESFMRDQNLISAGTFSEDDIAKAKALRGRLNATILTNTGWDALKSEIERSKNEKWFGHARVGWLSSVQTPPDAATLKGLQDPISYDPAPILAKLTVPVLTINGGLDPYVETARSVPILAEALTKAGNRDATVVILPGASHGLLESETGLESETYRMKRHAHGYWATISDWLRRHLNTQD